MSGVPGVRADRQDPARVTVRRRSAKVQMFPMAAFTCYPNSGTFPAVPSSFLDRLIQRSLAKALKRAERQLGPLMEPGEEVLSADICHGGADLMEILSRRGPRVHVVVSTRAIYIVQRGGHVDRLTSTDISDVRFQQAPDRDDFIASAAWAAAGDMARLVVLTLWGGATIGLLPQGRLPAVLGSDLKKLVPDRTVAEHGIDLGGGQSVHVVQRRGRPGSIGFDWDYTPADGVDVESEPLRSVFREKMRLLMKAAGDPAADSAGR